jgi:hypothetical protein
MKTHSLQKVYEKIADVTMFHKRPRKVPKINSEIGAIGGQNYLAPVWV